MREQMKRFFVFVACVLIAATAVGQIKIVPEAPDAYKPVVVSVDLPSEAGWESVYDWEIGEPAQWLMADDQLRQDARQNSVHVWAPPGSYKVKLTVDSINWEQKKRTKRKFDATLVVKGVVPPVPPIPPGPTPPVPDPPMPVSGLYVMGVIDSVASADKFGVVNAKEVRDLLESNCAKDASGSPAYRWFAPTSDLSKELPIWQEAMKTPHPGIDPPYWIVSNGKQKWVEAWPKDVAAAKTRITEAIQGAK